MLSTPKRPYHMPLAGFIPLRLVGLAIFNEIYDETEHSNLKEVRADAERVSKFFKSLGIKNEDTTFLWNGTYQDLDKLVTELKLKYLAAQKDGVNTLFVIWYGGHGAMLNNTTQVVVNDSDPKQSFYPLELNLNHFLISNTLTRWSFWIAAERYSNSMAQEWVAETDLKMSWQHH